MRLFLGILLAVRLRTASSWFLPVGISDDFRQAYRLINLVGKKNKRFARPILRQILTQICPTDQPLVVAIDDTPTRRYGLHVQGCGIHRNPTPGPADKRVLYGHVWVVIALLVRHPNRGTIALPLLAELYVRKKDVEAAPEKDFTWTFRTKTELAIALLDWLTEAGGKEYKERIVVVDGGYAKTSFVASAKSNGWTVVSRLRRDAALWTEPPAGNNRRKYGTNRVSLQRRGEHSQGWREVRCEQYGEDVVKSAKSFHATWRPAGGRIEVTIVRESHGWIAFFSTSGELGSSRILSLMADRGAIEQMNKDVKEVWGGNEQQVRNIESNVGCFNMNLWWFSLVELWSWEKSDEELCDRRNRPWDDEPRRPSHRDKRRALQKTLLRERMREVLTSPGRVLNVEEEVNVWLSYML